MVSNRAALAVHHEDFKMYALIAVAITAAVSLAMLPILIILSSMGMIADATAYDVGFCSVIVFVTCLPLTVAATFCDYLIGLVWSKI